MTTQAITTQQIDINTILNTLIMLMVVMMIRGRP
jgi:hypothetical protein